MKWPNCFFQEKDPGSFSSARVHWRQLETGRHCHGDTLPLNLNGTFSRNLRNGTKPLTKITQRISRIHTYAEQQVLLVLNQLPLNFVKELLVLSIRHCMSHTCPAVFNTSLKLLQMHQGVSRWHVCIQLDWLTASYIKAHTQKATGGLCASGAGHGRHWKFKFPSEKAHKLPQITESGQAFKKQPCLLNFE